VTSSLSLVPREAMVEEELFHLIRVVLDKNGSKLNGVEFGRIQAQRPVNGGIADLVLPFADGKNFLVIECKRKITKPSGVQMLRDFDIFGSNVLNQALNYATRLGALAFATTNGSRLALFRTPKQAGEPFRIDTHRLLVVDPFKLDEKGVEKFLSFLAKWQIGIPVALTQIDWFFISRLRSFVDFLSKSLSPVIKELVSDKTSLKKLGEFSKKVGGVTTEQLARETAYLLMNKIIFYKILERHYEGLPKLKRISAPDGKYFTEFLKGYFEKAIEVTGDFEPIFITEFYDNIPLPTLDYVLDELNSFIEEMDTYKLEEVGSDVVGHIYEELLPDIERHKLGQFYTPPPIAELIVKWAVRNPNDVILDPAVGSGTFLVKAYQRLMELKVKECKKIRQQVDSAVMHKEVLSQLYADDINPFPAHLTSMNLAMRNVQCPTSEMNIIVEDFFNLRSRMNVFAPFVMKTPKGEIRRHVSVPSFDAIVANPPYTRGVEITDKTQKSINLSLEELLKKHKLSGGIGKETGIYVYFIMHCLEFLKKHGRVGMIVSNSWLQSDYGINFCNFLIANFKVKAVIDFNQRLFRIPLVATCVLLLEKEADPQARNENNTIFLYVNSERKVDEILDALDNPHGWKAKFLINTVKQGSLPKDQKWIREFFDTEDIETAILKSPLMVLTNVLFNSRYGNMLGVAARGGSGADRFFYLSKQDVNKWNIPDAYLSQLLVRSRYNKFFTFTSNDWKKLKNSGKPCYAFVCHKPKNSLPRRVKEFIQWGETTELVRVKADEEPKTATQSMASMGREKDKEHFFGWYDLGGILEAPIFTSRRSQYYHRFVMSEGPRLAIDDGFITFVPKERLSETQLTATLASLNSGIGRLFVEIYGRSTGGGVIELDDKSAGKVPTLNCDKLSRDQVATMSELFYKLEKETRRIGEAETKESFQKLQPIIDEIDVEIAGILGLKTATLERIKDIVKFFFERRVSRTEKASPESVKGEEEPRVTPPKKLKKQQKPMADKQITRWIEKK
jgi:type I restriction-modification system DNA methylase subunit